MAQQLFVFVQLEFPWLLGPADGRYLVRRESGDPEHVIVLGTLSARQQLGGSPPRLRRRARSAPTDAEPAPVATTRATVIDPVSLSAEIQARAWLAELDREREVEVAMAVLNRVIHTHRVVSADPYVREVSAPQALVIRAGWGEGEQVADGRWLHARALVPGAPARAGARRKRTGERSWALRPQERLAALLGARGSVLLCEEVVLRARLDVDQGRLAHGALELDRAYELAIDELRREERQELAIRLAELEQLSAGVREQAARATRAEALDDDVLAHALERLEAALRARTAAGL